MVPEDVGAELEGDPRRFAPPVRGRREIVLLGAAGDRIISAGLLLAHAAILGGMQATQKNDYDITVMRGPSVSELLGLSRTDPFCRGRKG